MHNLRKREMRNPAVVAIVLGLFCCILVGLGCAYALTWFILEKGMELKLYEASSYIVHPIAVFVGTIVGIRVLKGKKGTIATVIPCAYMVFVIGINLLIIDAGTENVIQCMIGVALGTMAAFALCAHGKRGANKRKYKRLSR